MRNGINYGAGLGMRYWIAATSAAARTSITYVANMEDSPIIISDDEGDIGSASSAASSPHNCVKSSSEQDVPEAEEIESETRRTSYVREESQGGSSNRREIELLPRQSSIISIDQEDERRQFGLQSVITASATSPGAQNNEAICICVSDSPPNSPESMNTILDEQHASNVTNNMLKQEDKEGRSVPMRNKRNNNNIISVVGYIENSIITQPQTLNEFCGDYPLTISEQITSCNTQRNIERSRQPIEPEDDFIQMQNAHARATIAAQTPGGNGSTESTIPHPQPTTITNRTIGESTPITIESPPSTMHVHPTTMSRVANQESGSTIQSLVGASAQTVGNGNNSESTQPTASQVPLKTVNADVLEQVIKLAASRCEQLKPDDGSAEKYEMYLYRLLTNLEEEPRREHEISVPGVASGTHIPGSYQSVHESHRSSCTGISDNDVICVSNDSPPISSRQAVQQALSSIPEKFNSHNTSTSAQLYMQQSSTYTLTPTTLASKMEGLIFLTTESSLSMCNERSFNSTLTEGELEDSFDDECSTPVPNQSQIHGLLRRELSNESSRSEHSAAPPRKRLKTTLERSQRSRSASVYWEDSEMPNEAMFPGTIEVLLTNTIQPGRNSCVKVTGYSFMNN